MAHKKGVGSSKNGRESASKRLGVKIFGGEACKAGNIMVDGTVQFKVGREDRRYVSVIPAEANAEA